MQFYKTYRPPITAEHHTCVGLGLELIKNLSSLEERFPGLTSRLYLASCEESVEDVISYTSELPDPLDSDKEHVMVALKINIAGRTGILLLDPGYHIGRVITIMKDGQYPHTGCFVQSNENLCRKEYSYRFADRGNEDYVYWQVKEQRPNTPEKLTKNLVYVGVPYLSPVDVTERRNLVYEFKCLVKRNAKGQLLAGVYFAITTKGVDKFTLFYQDGEVTKRVKMDFGVFEKLTSVEEESLASCNKQLEFGEGKLTSILLYLKNNIICDLGFIRQVLSINQKIYDPGQDDE